MENLGTVTRGEHSEKSTESRPSLLNNLVDHSLQPLLKKMAEAFETVKAPLFLSPYLLAARDTGSSLEKFTVWADSFIEQACFEIFNHTGDIRPENLEWFLDSSVFSEMLNQFSIKKFRKYFLVGFFECFVSPEIKAAKDLPEAFKQHWFDYFAKIASDFDVLVCLKRYCDREWKRLCELWSLAQSFAKNLTSEVDQFCRVMSCLFYQTNRYLDCIDDYPLDVSKLALMTEVIFDEIGSVRLELPESEVLAGLNEAFCRLGSDNWGVDAFKGLPPGEQYLKNICLNQSVFISQLFISGVDFCGKDVDENLEFLLADHEPNLDILSFVAQLPKTYFHRRYDIMEERKFLKNAQSAVSDYKRSLCVSQPFPDQLLLVAEIRQLFLYLVGDLGGQMALLDKVSAEGIYLVEEFDKIMEHGISSAPAASCH